MIDGDAGNDTTEVNGNPVGDETFTIAPGLAPRVEFKRTTAVTFTLDMATERLVLNMGGGNDTATGAAGLEPLLLMTINGGVGDDAITGGDGADLLLGGDGVDVLTGGGGDDRLVADRGNDTMIGGNGDDVMVWNNGDGTDVIERRGRARHGRGERSSTVGDEFEVAPNGARVDFDRNNLGLFSLDIGTSEALDVRGAAGNDTFTV